MQQTPQTQIYTFISNYVAYNNCKQYVGKQPINYLKIQYNITDMLYTIINLLRM